MPPLPPLMLPTLPRGKGETKTLGTREFDGVKADGTQTTHTIPAGEIGEVGDTAMFFFFSWFRLVLLSPGMKTPWPTIGSTMKTATSSPRNASSSASRSLNGTVEVGQQRPEARGSERAPARGECAEGHPVVTVLHRHDLAPLRCDAPELQRGLDRLGAAVREEAALDARRRAENQLLGQDPGERRDAHLDGVRSLELHALRRATRARAGGCARR